MSDASTRSRAHAGPPSAHAEPPLPYSRQWIDDADVEAVAAVLRGEWLTTGPAVDHFEGALGAATRAPHVVAVSSGTAALHAAYAAFGGAPGAALVTSPLTFVATASAALHLGMDVAFADVDARTGLLDPGAARAALDALGARARILAPVDYAGHPADARAFESLAAERDGLRVVIDGSHSLGAARGGRRVGEMGDATTLSFHPVKPITTGEGGAVATRDGAAALAMRQFRSHGMRRGERAGGGATDDAWAYDVAEPAFNFRLPDVACALGASQLRRLDAFVARRRAIAARYASDLADVTALELPVVEPGAEPGWHLYVVRVREAARRRAFFDALRARGLGVQVHYAPVHLLSLFRARGHREGELPRAEDFARRAVSIPLFPAMSDGDVARVVDAVHDAAREVL
ncbi:MAG: DegT/DnrJ/EryC1/StrS family aminotransferase [Myxococcales bacterium]|nr:DegT/DnrJ/EryC1/StrS family aminotransferase [Myxococcales bacterium]